MEGSLTEVLVIFLLLVANGAFAMAELALLSARKVRLQMRADEGDRSARVALELAERPEQFLATVQIGITLVGIMTGVFGGATIANSLAALFRLVPPLAPYGEELGVGIVIILLTYFSLVIGELAPKRIALTNPERIASLVAAPMRALSRWTLPVARVLNASTELSVRVLGIKPSTEPSVTDEEIKGLVAEGRKGGIFEAAEQDMIEQVLELGERPIGALMTPRKQIVWLDVTDSWELIRQKIGSCHHSRFPVARASLDNVLGIVRVTDLLVRTEVGQPIDWQALARPPLFVPERMPALQTLAAFQQKRMHIALVVDEYGMVQGLVTHNDILEAIVGAMPATNEVGEPQAIQRADGSWLLDGLLSIAQLKKLCQVEQLPDEEHNAYHTVGGFVIHQLGNIPSVGQQFEWQRFRFEVVDMDGWRVDKVLMSRVPAREAT
jgi:putative hemolysin